MCSSDLVPTGHKSCLHFLVTKFPAPPEVFAPCVPLPVADDAPGVYGRHVQRYIYDFATATADVRCWHFHLPLPGHQCWHLRQVRTGIRPRVYSTISASEGPLIRAISGRNRNPGTAPRSQVGSSCPHWHGLAGVPVYQPDAVVIKRGAEGVPEGFLQPGVPGAVFHYGSAH